MLCPCLRIEDSTKSAPSTVESGRSSEVKADDPEKDKSGRSGMKADDPWMKADDPPESRRSFG